MDAYEDALTKVLLPDGAPGKINSMYSLIYILNIYIMQYEITNKRMYIINYSNFNV